MERVRQWPRLCDAEHGRECRDRGVDALAITSSDMLLIDVDRQCLCNATGTEEYLALSYVWGSLDQVLETRRDNLTQLHNPGALDFGGLGHRLPETVRDSMRLTKILHHRYLWVDRLCIVQNDPQHLVSQLGSMAAIYAKAYFTIVAANGYDATFGLRGIGHGSNPRSYQQQFLEILPECRLLHNRRLVSLNLTKYNSRGWTFQELLISRRLLIFSHEKIYWECHKCFWDEELAEDEIQQPLKPPPHCNTLTIPTWPNISAYSNLVFEYTGRQLSFESDIQNAFLAMIKALTPSYGEFLFGLPESLFDICLLWMTDRDTQSERRSLEESFPSWSWMGWRGQPTLRFWNTNISWRQELIRNPNVQVYSITDYYKIDRHTGERVLIKQNQVLVPNQAQAGPLRSVETLPPGWKHTTDTKAEAHYFLHENIPNEVFRLPFPLPTIPSNDGLNAYTTQIAFRSCRTQFRRSKEKDVLGNYSMLMNEAGETVGIIQVCDENQDEDKCELVALSKAVDWEGDNCLMYEEQLKYEERAFRYGKEPYWYYNVMWIRWKGGMAYMKSLGRVLCLYWDSATKEEVDIVLG
jgi:hypothetical protein